MRPSLTARNFINVKQCLSEKEVRMLAKVLAFERIINLCVDGRKHPRERLTSKSHKIMQLPYIRIDEKCSATSTLMITCIFRS